MPSFIEANLTDPYLMKHLIHTTLVIALFLTSAGSPAQDQTTLVEKMWPSIIRPLDSAGGMEGDKKVMQP